jgi:hypothetical protein
MSTGVKQYNADLDRSSHGQVAARAEMGGAHQERGEERSGQLKCRVEQFKNEKDSC